MPSCGICIDELRTPVSLPCGHVFCNDCVYRAVTALKTYTPLHYCPTCRAPYTTVNMDSSVVPNHLRPHVLPHIRRLFLDEHRPLVDDNMPSSSAFTECSRLSAENSTLRFNCDMWRKRAEVHAAATVGLLNVARDARNENLQLKKERDELDRKYNMLKRKFDVDDKYPSEPPSSSSSSSSDTPEYCCRSIYVPTKDHRPRSRVDTIRVSTGHNQPQPVACSAWTDIAKIIKQDDSGTVKRRRTDIPAAVESTVTGLSPLQMTPIHNVDEELLVPSLSRRKSASPSMGLS